VTLPPSALVDPSLELHWAAQVVAAAGQTFVEPRPDDSHRAMTWDPQQRALVGEPFAGSYPFRVALRPEDLTLVLVERTDEALGSLPLSGVTLGEAYEWLALGLATYMGALPTLERPEYDMPSHPVGAGARFAGGRDLERSALATLYGGAATLLTELVSTRDDASAIRCWPHHFDIAALLTIAVDESGAAVRTVGAGLAPLGGGYESWYWYVTPWPYPPADRLPRLHGPGAWHTDGWTGAVLTGEELASRDEAFVEPAVRKFLDVSVEAASAALDG
jgi:hypothetical protein